VNSGADRRVDITRKTSEVELHFSNRLFDDAFHGAPPASVDNSNGSMLYVDEDDWKAVGGLHGENDTGLLREQAVADESILRNLADAVDQVRMNLTKGDQRPGLLASDGADLPQEDCPVTLDCGARIVFGESQV
jgi:hypothetical protein